MNKFMKLAIAEAKRGIRLGHGGPFGSVIVKDGEVIAKGHNKVIKNRDATCHGEIMAIRAASKKLGRFDLSDCEIYTTAEPCPMCLGAIMWANISKVFYGATVDDTEDIGFRDKRFYAESRSGESSLCTELDRDACLDLYKEYKCISDKEEY